MKNWVLKDTLQNSFVTNGDGTIKLYPSRDKARSARRNKSQRNQLRITRVELGELANQPRA